MASGHSLVSQFLSKGFSRWQVFPGKTILLVFLEVFVALGTLPSLRNAEQIIADTTFIWQNFPSPRDHFQLMCRLVILLVTIL